MGALILVDLDNLVGAADDKKEVGELALTWALTEGRALPAHLTVTVALNTTTAQRFRDVAGLKQTTLTLLGDLPAGVVSHWEILLVLTMPDAADEALVRALRLAASVNAQSLDRVVLVTFDEGLRSEVAASLGPAVTRDGVSYWVPAGLQRSAPTLPIRAGAAAPASTEWEAVDTPAAAAAVGALSVQWPLDILRFDRLARYVEDAPGFLTQVGPTAKSHRGAARLTELLAVPRTHLPTLACGAGDGLERYGERVDPAKLPVAVSAHSLGPGVVAVAGAGFRRVVRTRYPHEIVAAASAAHSDNLAAVSWGQTIVANHPPVPAHSPVKVHLSPTIATLRSLTGERLWWVLDKPEGKLNLRGFCRTSFEVDATLTTALDSTTSHVMVIARSASVKVHLPQGMPPKSIWRAKAGGRDVALISPTSVPRGSYDTTPIWNYAQFPPGWPKELRMLPLLVVLPAAQPLRPRSDPAATSIT